MDSRASDVLKKQRYLAAQTLQKADDMREKSPLNGKGPTRSSRFVLSPPTQDWEDTRSDNGSMLQPRQYRAVNITELEEDKTIHLQATPQKVSFEPKEIAARSTMEKIADQTRRKLAMEQMAPDIHAILNNSIAPEVRELSGMYSGRSSTDSAVHLLRSDDRPDVSLPRTADMSRVSAMRESISSNASKNVQGDFWDLPANEAAAPFASSWMQKELTQLEDISFHPAESQQSRLMADELAWEQENAIIPQMNANKGSKSGISPVERLKLPRNLKNHVDFSCFSGYLAQEEAGPMHATRIEDSSYCSVGEYFNKMSDDLKGMISQTSPPRRTPLPLVDVSNIEHTDESNGKTPAKSRTNPQSLSDTTDKENSLSVSKIMKAIDAIHLEDSPSDFINKIQHLRKGKSGRDGLTRERPSMPSTPKPQSPAVVHKTASLRTDLASVVQTPSFVSDLKEAKQRALKPGNLSDTASFTESLLESSAFVPIDPRVITSSPKEMSAPSSAAKSVQSEVDGTYNVSTAKKPFLNTYRVSTATKLSENQLDLPPIPMIREAPKCQKKIALEGPPVKPNRKRRSSSATRQELLDAEEKRLDVANTQQKRSRSPTNIAELKAVSSQLTVYNETPKSSIPSQRSVQPKQTNRSFLSPEPRNRDIYTNDKSPFTSPKSIGSSDLGEVDRAAYSEPSKSPKRYNMLGSARSASQCSVASSEFSHRDGVLPLKATHSELSWPSTKLRRSEKKSIQIKNMSNKKLIIKASITGPGFQLCGTEQVLTLHSQECRTVTIDFCPTVIGPAVGLLSFLPPHDNYAHRSVSLFGYGGEASIRAEGIQKGPTGPYLELGQARNLGRPLEKSFTLYNKGSLPAFARIAIDMKKVDQTFLASAVFVQPQKVIIPPNTYVHINVSFKPRRQEIAKILQKHVDVLSITNLHIIWGDEATRHRIRRIISMIKRNDLHEENLSPLASVCEFIPNEREFSELDCFAENLFQTVHELFLTFREYELVLTIDRALDETMIDFTLTEDSSALFKTMCISSEGGSPRLPEDISPALQSAKRQSGESWSVRPTFLEFSSSERTKQFVIKSNFYTTQFFDLNSNFRPLFKFSPMEGQIRPGQEVIVNVNFLTGPQPQQPVFIVVYIENEKITIPVHIRNRNRYETGVAH
ncbi:uncharacterized protein LOC5571717 [Aedes aegypti]|uniref:Uncharacterized protein n=1 Tax=Aedes aegypti TaxID=7159 RepID=A0A1S4FLX5_AEDAE|nr:uncharacterized protein LOC5571717 [Aedes aegypti]